MVKPLHGKSPIDSIAYDSKIKLKNYGVSDKFG